jgi:hypothetical protein
MFVRCLSPAVRLAAVALAAGVVLQAAPIRVTIRNFAPAGGTFQTPLWVGFHDGSFDIYDSGASASTAVERIAEDGETGPISDAFTASGAGSMQGVIAGSMGAIGPGEMASALFNLEPTSASSRYFSYASMVIPSNDAFIANGNPMAFPIFDEMGNFLGANFIVMGSMVLDAGTEVNDELPLNTAFFGQMTPNTGVDENGVVGMHPGFMPPGSGGILDDPMFTNADFTAAGYQIAQIRVDLVPEPGSVTLVLIAGLALAALSIRQRRR